jgi:hypothetical protein
MMNQSLRRRNGGPEWNIGRARRKGSFVKIDASYTGKHETHEVAPPEIQTHIERLDKLQYLLYADGKQSLLVMLQRALH